MMRRWVVVFLLLVVPAQLIWAAAAPYCGHETSTAGKRHFGHHEHRHQSGDPAAASAADQSAWPGGSDADCDACHLGASAALPVPTVVVGVAAQHPPHDAPRSRYASHIPPEPERPDWADSTAAVRSGDGVV